MDEEKAVRNEIIALSRHTSKSNREIARDLSVSHTLVNKVVKQYQDSGDYETKRRGNCGRKEKLTQRDRSVIVREAKKNPHASSGEIQRNISGVGASVSTRTIRRVLNDEGVITYKPIRKPCFTSAQKSKRLQWGSEHRNWSDENWKQVCVFIYFFQFSQKIIFISCPYY